MLEHPKNEQENSHELVARNLESRMLAAAKDENIHEKGDQIIAFSKKIKEKYSNFGDYLMYHVLVGSTLRTKPLFDFPGEDSVEKFLDDLLK